MPAYNAERYVAEAVESVLSQDFGDLELVVVDDGSTDGTRVILQGYAAADPRVRLISRPNTGLIGARTDTLRAATGEFLAYLDADDIALPGRLRGQVDYLRRHPDCVLVASRVIVIDPESEPLCVMGEAMEHEELERALLEARGQFLYNSSVMTRRRAVLEIGGYTPDTDPAEDFDLFLRLAEVGRMVSLAEPVAMYREHLSKVGHTRARRQGEACRAILLEAHRRRGLEPPETVRRLSFPTIEPADRYRVWGWWALGAGHVATARKYARAHLAGRPLSPRAWRLLYCALRGR
jgi:glycosyltransferase involved in cell wall biosynthesis